MILAGKEVCSFQLPGTIARLESRSGKQAGRVSLVQAVEVTKSGATLASAN